MASQVIYRSSNCDADAVRGLRAALLSIGFASGEIRGNGECHGFRATHDSATLTVDWYYGGLLEVSLDGEMKADVRSELLTVIANQPDVNRPVI
jgi:hypothetical protein